MRHPTWLFFSILHAEESGKCFYFQHTYSFGIPQLPTVLTLKFRRALAVSLVSPGLGTTWRSRLRSVCTRGGGKLRRWETASPQTLRPGIPGLEMRQSGSFGTDLMQSTGEFKVKSLLPRVPRQGQRGESSSRRLGPLRAGQGFGRGRATRWRCCTTSIAPQPGQGAGRQPPGRRTPETVGVG